MISFKKFILEQTSNESFDLQSFRSIHSKFYPDFGVKYPKYAQKYAESITNMERALEAKVTYNPVFADIKHWVNSICDKVFDYLNYTVYGDELRKNNEWSYSSFSFVSIKKILAHFKKFGSRYNLIVEFCEIIVHFKDAMDLLKSYIQKGRAPKPVDPNAKQAFVKPMASADAQKQVITLLSEATNDIRPEYEKYFENLNRKDFDNVTKFYDKETQKFKFENDKQKDIYDSIVQKYYEYIYSKKIFIAKSDVNEIIEKTAKQEVRYILDEFLQKNTSKLALIFQKKQKLTEHKIISNKIKQGTFENIMYFKFDDNSSFRIYSNVEYSRSKYDKLFLKMPTRFTDVVFADGSKMAGPSEEKMIKDF